VPAIWTGGMVLHKEYVTPFAPMNALEKLIDRNGYQRFISKDHISELFTPSAETVWLDRGVEEMEHSFCGTVQELEADLENRRRDAPPIFALTRPLDLHVSKIRGAAAPAGESYPGFDAAYAARVRRIDACFGSFVDGLKQTGLYADSAIVVMADHGDSLGEEQRWGHAYTLFPEVMRIPLIVHLPPALSGTVTADLSRVSFSTDVTPTLYALLGYHPADLGPLFGEPLFDGPGIDRTSRPRASTLIASSYGAVYGVISDNGRALYIADAINEREYAYRIDTTSLLGTRVGIGDADRARNRQLIRTQIGQLASEYHFSPQP
jgi:arylsulfatase A-like enzyme